MEEEQLIRLFLILLVLTGADIAGAQDAGKHKDDTYDCSLFKPFQPLDIVHADIEVYRKNAGTSDSEMVEICHADRLPVAVKDIRNRESDWFYCDGAKAAEFLSCDITYKGKPARVTVTPAMVIRRWKPSDALDTNVHVRLFPEGDEERLFDNYAGSTGFDLKVRSMTLSASSGGRGIKAGEDYFYTRVTISP